MFKNDSSKGTQNFVFLYVHKYLHKYKNKTKNDLHNFRGITYLYENAKSGFVWCIKNVSSLFIVTW